MRRRNFSWPNRVSSFAVIAILALAACQVSPAPVVEQPVPMHNYPRTAAVFLAASNLPAAEVLATNDVIIIDSEWGHKLPRSYFEELRQRNPNLKLLAYVNIVDMPMKLDTSAENEFRYRLWKFEAPTRNSFPTDWLARTSSGDVVSEFPGTSMVNLTDRAPTVDGRRFIDHAVDWLQSTVWAAGVWDGIFLDVWGDRVYGATKDSWDINGDGSDEPNNEIYGAGGPWERGVNQAEKVLRERLPSAVLVANGDRTLRERQLDGRMWENFADVTRGRDPAFDLQRYVEASAGELHRQPGLFVTLNRRRESGPLTADDLRRARFFLTGTLMQDGYWAAAGTDYDELVQYDETDGGGLGRGYLGAPLVTDPALADVQGPFGQGVGLVAENVYRRDFENGTVLHNAGPVERTVNLGQRYRRLSGRQDPITNDGSVVTSVTVPGHDGLILRTDQPDREAR